MRHLPVIAATVVALTGGALAPPVASAQVPEKPPAADGSDDQVQKFTLYDGSQVEIGSDGIGWQTDAKGGNRRPIAAVAPQARSALGDKPGPDKTALIDKLSTGPRSGSVPGDVLMVLSSATVDGAALRSPKGHQLRAAHTSDSRVNTALRAVAAKSMEPVFGTVAATRVKGLDAAATTRLGAGALDLGRAYLVQVAGDSSAQAATRLRSTPGVAYAEPDFYVSTFHTDPVELPSGVSSTAPAGGHAASGSTSDGSPSNSAAPQQDKTDLPGNFGLQYSFQSYLNANGINLPGAYTDIAQRFHQVPGDGEIITNVSLGDLTDQSMADAGDPYVQELGPTTVVDGGQRYLQFPVLPRIPTYTADMAAKLDPVGSVEHVDPNLTEVLLDFSVMAPAPHAPANKTYLDLLGIAPGAQYRLVEPQQPTTANILTAMIAAAQQTPKPDVINASLGFGTDGQGYAGRYLEDDPLMRSVIAGIVQHDGIAVTIAANDGTRMFTPAPVGPDGGSTPTDLPAAHQSPTSISDDASSTTPSVVPDSGAIAVGGTTLDDTIAVPLQTGSALSRTGTLAETRLNGSANFSSGFGTRVNVSAPSDNIPALWHPTSTSPSSAVAVLEGGTSASAPMTAAAVADILQVARLTGHPMKPDAVRALLEKTGRAVPTPPQVDRSLHVGPQIDLTRAVESVLGEPHGTKAGIVRVSVAHRMPTGDAGADFIDATDPTYLDLQGPNNSDPGVPEKTGEGLVGPVTIGIDATGVPQDRRVSYVLRVGSKQFVSDTPSIRVTPAELLAASGQPLVSGTDRAVGLTVQIRGGAGEILTSASQRLTVGPTDGTHVMAPAPVVSPVVEAGKPVQVKYDLRGIRATDVNGTPTLKDPKLVVSSIGHWSPFTAPMFRAAYSVPLTASSGTVTIPASAFAAGAGSYGVVVEQSPEVTMFGVPASLRVADGAIADRPAAPTLAATGSQLGHQAVVTRAKPTFQLHWDAGGVPGATGAMLEVSAPGPTIQNLYSTFTNQNGSRRDHNGVDTGSSYWAALPSRTGTTTVNPAKLGLGSSLNYNVRIFATHDGKVTGQASPSSGLEYDDGLAPDGQQIDDFDVDPSGTAAVATSSTDPIGHLQTSSIYRYSPATGAYGPTYAHQTAGGNAYVLYGSDPSQHRLIAAEYPGNGSGQSSQHLLTYDTSSGKQVADVPSDRYTDYFLIGGRVDAQRHRAAILAWKPDGTDVVLPVDTTTGKTGTPVPADNGVSTPDFYSKLDIDRSTGNVDLVSSFQGDNCLLRKGGFTSVNLDTLTATAMTPLERCDTGVASDQAGHAEVTLGPLISFPILSPAGLQQVDEASGQGAERQQLQSCSPLFPIVDPVHHLLIVAFIAGGDYRVDNNGMSQVGVYDLNTGAQVSLSKRFNFFSTASSGMPSTRYLGSLETERGIQIDPKTRTAWTYGPDGRQVQQFTY